MSASLVGSEMCIRDRDSSQGCAALARCSYARGAGGLAALSGAGDCRKPVSYTHLTLPTICSV
eukprot:12119570-Alexandrium_andersonii.AAC.1